MLHAATTGDESKAAATTLPEGAGAVPGGVRDTAGAVVRLPPLLRAVLPGVPRSVQLRLRRRQDVRMLGRRPAVRVPRLPHHHRGGPQRGVQRHVTGVPCPVLVHGQVL
jgi:hypothetical protein